MIRVRRLTVTIAALAIAGGAPALAQQSKARQGCINTINKDAALVGKTQGKENVACVKEGIKGSVASNCPSADLKQKVATRIAKTITDDMARCTETPDFAYTGAGAGGAYRQAELDLLADVFGGMDLSASVSSDAEIGPCQYAVIKGVEKVSAAASKAFVQCKKTALKGAAVSALDVQACVGSDGKSKVAGAAAKLAEVVADRCSAVTISAAFPGECSGSISTTALADCLTARAKCRMCQAANGADALSASCETVDDGMSNGSCL